MKKVLSLLLCLILLLSLSACGDGYKTDKKAKAEDIFPVAMQNLSATLKNLLTPEAESTQLKYTLSGNASASLDLPIPSTDGGSSSKVQINGKLNGSGEADNKKGLSLTLNAETDALKALGPILGGMMDSSSSEDLKIELGLYVDQEAHRLYQKTMDDEQWSYSEFTTLAQESNLKELDKLNTVTLDQVFEKYEFTINKEEYVFEGTANVSALSGIGTDASGLPVDPKTVSQAMEMLKGLKPAVKIVVNADKKITSLQLKIQDFTVDLGAMMPLSAVIKELSLDFGIQYENVNFSVPANVKTEAEAAH